MSLLDIVLGQLAIARKIIEAGEDVVPAWRILTPGATYLLVTPFTTDDPEQRERVLAMVSKFMAWKMATGFVLTAETWLGPEPTRAGDEALFSVGVAYDGELGVIQRITRGDGTSFGLLERLSRDQIDDVYLQLLPRGASEMTAEEIAELSEVFGEEGELEAEELS